MFTRARWLPVFSLVLACGAPPAGLSPASGPKSGGTTLRIAGEGFAGHGAPAVYIGEAYSRAVVVQGDRLMTVMTPKSEVVGEPLDVRVVFSDGTQLEFEGAFTYEADETIRVVKPD